MRREKSSSSSLSVALLIIAATTRTGLSTEAPQCDPSRHICGGRCPALPPDSHPPEGAWKGGGVCLRDEETGACVCWLRNEGSAHSESPHLQTLFRCEVPLQNGGVRHVMCLPPAHCFPPDAEWGCMIVPHCPCSAHQPSQKSSRWHPVVAILLRSTKPVQQREEAGSVPTSSPSSADERGQEEDKEKNPNAGGESPSSREFSLRHLLFLVAFVVAPLLCWCTLTFFNGKRCRVGKMPGEGVASEEEERQQRQPLANERCEEVRDPPSAPPKPTEAPPPPSYEAAVEDGRTTTVVVVVDCGAPPPPYEDAVREECHRWSTNQGTS